MRSQKLRSTPPGASPGHLRVPEGTLKAIIQSFVYDEGICLEAELHSIEEVKELLQRHSGQTVWIDIHGFGTNDFLEKLSACFSIHRLQMEDVVNVYQRPKVEESGESLFLVSRVMKEQEGHLQNDQLSIFLNTNFVLTMQDTYEDQLDPVRMRIRNGKGAIRKSGTAYLVYALMDVVLDNFFPILERMGEKLDVLQDALIDQPDRELLNQVLDIKRDLSVLRRVAWSERDKLNDLLRNNYTQLNESTRIYIRDSYDHCIQILDLVESYREVTASLVDVYHSSVSNKMNQVMRLLTIISTTFIPLTFIVGVYGMNFVRENPVDGRTLPWNMPELYSPYGYPVVMLIMILIVILQLIYFYRKGWLNRS